MREGPPRACTSFCRALHYRRSSGCCGQGHTRGPAGSAAHYAAPAITALLLKRPRLHPLQCQQALQPPQFLVPKLHTTLALCPGGKHMPIWPSAQVSASPLLFFAQGQHSQRSSPRRPVAVETAGPAPDRVAGHCRPLVLVTRVEGSARLLPATGSLGRSRDLAAPAFPNPFREGAKPNPNSNWAGFPVGAPQLGCHLAHCGSRSLL